MDKQKLQELLDKELNESKDTILGSFVSQLIQRCRDQQSVPVGTALAASFDLLVGVFYYQKVPNRGWLQCSCGPEQYYFPFVNVCPRCAIETQPFYHKAGKSQSGSIGTATVKALILFIQEWFAQNTNTLRVVKGEEPVDLYIFDEQNNTLLLAEVKSSPLLILPLVIIPEKTDTEEATHESLTMSTFKEASMGLMLPTFDKKNWKAVTWPFGKRFDGNDNYFVDMVADLLARDTFFHTYLSSWQRAFTAYSAKDKTDAIFG